jgi:thiol-disulfide isomerase/thioredoxin
MRWLIALALVACGRDHDPPPAGASILARERAPAHTSAPAATVPPALRDIVLVDAAGAPAALADRLRETNLLVFWASWCEPCMMELPFVDRYAASEHDPRVAVIAINVDAKADRQAALAAIASHHIAMPVLFDPDTTTYEAAIGRELDELPNLAVISREPTETESGFEEDLTPEQHVAHFRDLVHAHVHYPVRPRP